MSANKFTITCGGCKRRYEWKKERAGNRGKCKCGRTISMPLKPPQAEEPEPDELFGLAELAADAQRAVVKPSRIAALPDVTPVSAPAAIPARLDYRRSKVAQESEQRIRGNLTDPIRDLYVPLGLFMVGFFGALAWVVFQTQYGTTGLFLMSALAAIFTAVKVAVVIGLALMVAPRLGISFGLLVPAILKFAAILIFVDSAEIWLDVILKATGAISPSGQGPSGFMFIRYDAYVRLGLATTLISLMCFYLFSMDSNEVAMFAVPMALVSWFIGVLINFVLLTITRAGAAAVIVAVHAPQIANLPAAVPATATAAAAPSTAPAAPDPMTAVDHTIYWRIHPPNGRSDVIGANKWLQVSGRKEANSPTSQLIAKMYGAGAVNVYIDLFGGMRQPAIPGAVGSLMYVQLPEDDSQIAACVSLAQGYRTQTGQNPNSPADGVTKEFLVIDLKR